MWKTVITSLSYITEIIFKEIIMTSAILFTSESVQNMDIIRGYSHSIFENIIVLCLWHYHLIEYRDKQTSLKSPIKLIWKYVVASKGIIDSVVVEMPQLSSLCCGHQQWHVRSLTLGPWDSHVSSYCPSLSHAKAARSRGIGCISSAAFLKHMLVISTVIQISCTDSLCQGNCGSWKITSNT